MDDSFSLFAKSIRQKKINKDELLNNLKEISETQTKKDKYIKNIIKIQKIVRGYLYRIKYSLSLDEINTKTIIDYLYEKKRNRIHNHSKEIISFFISKYINKTRKKKKNEILFEQYKIHCSNLIKARFKGILVRRKVKEKLILVKKAKKLIFKFILGYRTILILKSNTMQNLLVDIAKIKYQLKNLDKEKDYIKLKELKNKLSKNINLFHDTYYYTKENCNWAIEKKTSEKWDKKYFEIINKKSGKEVKNNKKESRSGNNGYTNYLLEFYNYSDDNDNDNDNDNKNDNEDINHNYLSNKKSHYNSTLNSTKKDNKYNDIYVNKKYETSKNVSEFNIDNLENRENNKKNINYEDDIYNKKMNNYTERDRPKFISDKHLKVNYNYKEENRKLRKEINDIDLNNINNNKIKKNKDEIFKKSSTNIYQQREERPIKPLNINNIINCENPFGLRENNFKKTNTLKEQNLFRNSLPYNNNNQFNNQNNQYQKRYTMKGNIKLKEQNEEKEKYGYDRAVSDKNNDYGYILNRDEKPIGGSKKINYEKIFGEDGDINFDGDPFGGVKQFETNKNKIHNKSNSTATRKKPIYDARKAIEEAKLKEAKEGKKEKHSEFREFLKEMKKVSAEEKLKKNNNKKEKENNDLGKIGSDSLDIKKSYSESLNKNGNGMLNGNNIYKNNYIEDENKNIENNNKKDNNITNNKREKSTNKSSNKMLRKKLHDLEKAAAPILNIKGAKSKIECWFDNNSNNNGNKYMEYTSKNTQSNKPNGQNKIKKSIVGEDDENNNSNNILNRKMENKIEKYVDKKLSQLNLQIDKLNDIFSIESYFEQKEIKMKQFINVPYINKKNIYVKTYSNEKYDSLINDIYKEYKNLK